MKKENLPLIIGLAIPVLMVIVLVAVIYLPRLYIKPTYNFVFATGSYPTYQDNATKEKTEYTVIDGRLTKDISAIVYHFSTYYSENSPKFYRYNVTEKKTLPISDKEVMRLSLDPSQTSPDGFVLNYGTQVDNVFEGLFGGGRDYSQHVLEKGSVSIPITLPLTDDRYSSNFHFVGWIKNSN